MVCHRRITHFKGAMVQGLGPIWGVNLHGNNGAGWDQAIGAKAKPFMGIKCEELATRESRGEWHWFSVGQAAALGFSLQVAARVGRRQARAIRDSQSAAPRPSLWMYPMPGVQPSLRDLCNAKRRMDWRMDENEGWKRRLEDGPGLESLPRGRRTAWQGAGTPFPGYSSRSKPFLASFQGINRFLRLRTMASFNSRRSSRSSTRWRKRFSSS